VSSRDHLARWVGLPPHEQPDQADVEERQSAAQRQLERERQEREQNERERQQRELELAAKRAQSDEKLNTEVVTATRTKQLVAEYMALDTDEKVHRFAVAAHQLGVAAARGETTSAGADVALGCFLAESGGQTQALIWFVSIAITAAIAEHTKNTTARKS
jgi:hypothetical protein